MPIISATRWNIDHDQAKKIAAEAAPLLKKHGASAIRVGSVYSGQHTGQTMVIVIYPDWETYGKAVHAQSMDAGYQHVFGQALKTGELLDRTLMVAQDI